MCLRRFLALAALLLCSTSASGQTTGIREVTASDRSVIPLDTKVRYTTMVVLPEDEEILDVICGDRDFWVISATHHVAHVKPAKEGAATNLNLVTASGAIYSFLLTEGKSAQPDLKVYVTAEPSIARATPKYYSATHVNALEEELTEARAAVQAAHLHSEEAIAAFQRDYPATLTFAYGSLKYERPFFVRSIWHDGAFTYIRSDARELPTLYELRDGQASLINFQVHDGLYMVPKVLERGYLALGTERFPFQQER